MVDALDTRKIPVAANGQFLVCWHLAAVVGASKVSRTANGGRTRGVR